MVAGLVSMRPLSIGSWREGSLAKLSQRRIDIACTRRSRPAGSADSKLKALQQLNAARMPAALQAWSIVAPRLPPSRITQTTRWPCWTGESDQAPDLAVKRNEAELAPNGSRRHCPPDGLRLLDHLRLMAMCFTLDCACGVFGIVTVSTPFLNAADTLSSSTSSTGMRRSKQP
jgi:hypothetical protein